VLDILLEHESTWEFLQELKGDPDHRDVPVLVLTVVDNRKKAMAMGADLFAMKPVDREWLIHTLRTLVEARKKDKLLVIDDDEVARYLLRGLLAQTRFKVVEAENGEEGLRKAAEEKPDVILLDIIMPDILGFEVLRRLKSDAATAAIPVIIYTSKTLTEAERKQVAGAAAILTKNSDSRDIALAELREALSNAISSAQFDASPA
jgi:CheY-like chemotaxis protein